MPYGKGTYGSKVGRPKKKSAMKPKKKGKKMLTTFAFYNCNIKVLKNFKA